MRLLTLCGALASGEFLASAFAGCPDVWPLLIVASLVFSLVGYGLRLRAWPIVSVFLLGIGLYFQASVQIEQAYRETPWARGREWMLAHPFSEGNAASRVRRELSRRVGLGLEDDRETAALARALLLGERRGVPRQTKRLFVASGTMHVFAISGLHVMAIANLLTILMAFVFIPRRLAGLVSMPLLWCYVIVIGHPPSAIRAATMASFSLLAPVFWRKPDALRAWSLAFLLIHLVSPRMITNVGNALSFAVMLAIVLVTDLTRDLPRWKQSLAVTAAAWAAGVPIAAHVFGSVTPGSILSNLVLIAAARLTVLSGALGVGASFLSETVARHVNNLGAIGIRAMVLVAEAVSRLPCMHIETECWPLATCLAWYAALALARLLAARVKARSRML